MNQPRPASPLQGLLDEEIAVLGDFLKILKQEEAALVAGDADGLVPVAQTKNQLAERLALIAERRAVLLNAAGLPQSRAGIETLITRQPGAKDVQQRWTTLLEQAREVKQRNELNGRLIAEKLSHNQQALQALSAAAERTALYGPDGQTRIGGSGRSFGRA
ncbi:MAG TPA: flagellar protein FlgN [Rhodocyclaceae bacterium]